MMKHLFPNRPRKRVPDKKEEAEVNAVGRPTSPVAFYEMIEVDDTLFMVHKKSNKAYHVDINETGDERALLDQYVGQFKDGKILPSKS